MKSVVPGATDMKATAVGDLFGKILRGETGRAVE